MITRREVRAVWPWSESGPGWSNRGVYTIVHEYHDDGHRTVSEECIYYHELGVDPRVFSAALALNEVLMDAARKHVGNAEEET